MARSPSSGRASAAVLAAALIACGSSAPIARASSVHAGPPQDAPTSEAADSVTAPNILFVLADDFGYNDAGWHGSEAETPFLDSLVAQGVALEEYYGHSICTPSRAALLTSRYASHTGLQHSYIHPGADVGLPLKFPTIADHLSGTHECHMVGKYHLGMMSDAYRPTSRGFKSYFGYLGGGEDYLTHETAGFLDLQENNTCATEYNGVYSAGLFANKTIDVIHAHAAARARGDTDKPLFMYTAFQSVHAPIEVPTPYAKPYSWINNTKRATMCGMITALDDSVRAIVDAIKQHDGMWENTILAFSADNGGPPYVANSNFPMRGGKWTTWNGGHRLAAFVTHGSGSDVLPHKNFTGLMHHVDWLPTLMEASGARLNDTVQPPVDGVSMWSALTAPTDTRGPREHTLLVVDQTNIGQTRDPHGWAGYAAIVAKNKTDGSYFKLMLGDGGKPDGWCLPNQPRGDMLATTVTVHGDMAATTCSVDQSPPANMADRTKPHLFDLAADPTETTDLAGSHKSKLADMQALLQQYVDSAVTPLNQYPSEQKMDPAAQAKAKEAGCWMPWKTDEHARSREAELGL